MSVAGYGISTAYNYLYSNQSISTITENANYVNPDGTGGRLNQDMAGATANSVSGGCEKAPVDYRGSNVIKDKADFYVAPSGEIYKYDDYPKDDGALGSWETTKLKPSTIIDRFGSSNGKYFSPNGTPIEQRSLAPWADTTQYHKYEVAEELDVASSIIAPYYNQPGGGIQYKSNYDATELIKQGKLKEIFGE